jgi:hypothetical protein
MSAGPGHPSLRQGVAQALADLLVRVAHSEVGRWLGVAQTTISRRGEDLRAWPADDLLRLCAHDAPLAEALVRCGTGGPEWQQAEPVRAVSELLAEVEAGGGLAAEIARTLTDGKIRPAEAKALRLRVEQRQRAERALLIDLRAIEAGQV